MIPRTDRNSPRSHSMATKDPEESLAELEQGEFNMSVSANAPITPT